MTELIVPQFPADVTYPLITDPTRPAHSLERLTFALPPAAVDALIHILRPLDVHPSVAKPFYSMPVAPLEQFISEEHTSDLQQLTRSPHSNYFFKKTRQLLY